jgi:hypothetical protein
MSSLQEHVLFSANQEKEQTGHRKLGKTQAVIIRSRTRLRP